MRRTAALTAVALLAVGASAAPSQAAKKKPKPITKTYTATAPMPDPSNYAGLGYSVCAQNVPQSFHEERFTAPAAGNLKVTLKDYTGDWDLLLEDGGGAELSYSGASDVGAPEEVYLKLKKKEQVVIVACNFAGAPTATVSYTFTFK